MQQNMEAPMQKNFMRADEKQQVPKAAPPKVPEATSTQGHFYLLKVPKATPPGTMPYNLGPDPRSATASSSQAPAPGPKAPSGPGDAIHHAIPAPPREPPPPVRPPPPSTPPPGHLVGTPDPSLTSSQVAAFESRLSGMQADIYRIGQMIQKLQQICSKLRTEQERWPC